MGVQQVLLSPDDETKAVLEYLCQQSGKLYNSGVYFARQTFFKTGKLLTGKFDLAYEPSVSKTMVAQSMPSTPAQQTLLSVIETFKSFKGLRSLFLNGQLHSKPKAPGYLTGSKLFKVAYPNSGGQKPTLINGQLRFSLGLTVKRWFGISEFFLPMPSNLDIAHVKEFTILPKNGAFYLEMSYEVEKQNHVLDINQALSIDLGTFKSNANIGRINNQKFVQMPLGKLKTRLMQLCDLHGIRFQETEEAYTSIASFLDGDSLPKFGVSEAGRSPKPDGWKASGRRIERGLYKSGNGSMINADLNGAANILRKVASNLSLDLGLLGRRCLTTVARIRLWALPKFTLSAESQSL